MFGRWKCDRRTLGSRYPGRERLPDMREVTLGFRETRCLTRTHFRHGLVHGLEVWQKESIYSEALWTIFRCTMSTDL